jgi:hypothetical protein
LLEGNMTKLWEFVVGKVSAMTRLFRAVRLRELPCVLLGWVLILLISPEEVVEESPESEEQARRRNGTQ